jgi:hypothetical protein
VAGQTAPVARAEPSTQPALRWFEDGRILFVGDGFIEQARHLGYIEARLARRSRERSVVCRNLGWSGDSVHGAARTAGYENPAGFERLMKEVAEVRPSVIFIGYGRVESFDGPAGLERFKQGYGDLLDALKRATPNLVLLSPTCEESSGAHGEDVSARNRDVEQYANVIAAIAAERKLPFIDLFHPLVEIKRAHPGLRLTSNGITPNDAGYWIVGDEIERQLGLRADPWRVELTADGKVRSARSADVTPGTAGEGLRFRLVEHFLPAPAAPDDLRKAGAATPGLPHLRVAGLGAGRWALKVDGQEVVAADAREWDAGVTLPSDPEQAVAEKLCGELVRSNELFYRRWRPLNDHSRHWTYIAGDYALYDRQLGEQDNVIAALRRPVGRECEIVRQEVPKP